MKGFAEAVSWHFKIKKTACRNNGSSGL